VTSCEYAALRVAAGRLLGCSVMVNCANAVALNVAVSAPMRTARASARAGPHCRQPEKVFENMRRRRHPESLVFPRTNLAFYG
jgi:hypothetical protein